jgi:chaperonin GroEL (HSP60 family)
MQTNQEKAQTAQSMNIQAAKAIANTVKSTLGPAGMDKMMVDGAGDVIVTNDGATILQELDVTHPGARMIVEAANMQESMCYDGTTSTVVLAGGLLSNSEALFQKGIHPNVICRGYRQASRWAVEHLNTLSVDAAEHLHRVAQTSITGKSIESSMDHVSNLCVDAVKSVKGEYERIRVLCQPGAALDDSYCFNGVVLHKEFMLPTMPAKPNGRAVLVNTGLQSEKMEDNLQVQFTSAEEFQSYRQTVGRDAWVSKADLISAALPDGGTLFARDNVDEVVAAMLARKDICVVQRIPESDMTALAHLLGVNPAHTPEDITLVGAATIEQTNIGDMKYIVVESEDDNHVTTLVLRGATKQTLDETERGFEDALGVVSLAYQSGQVVSGGGSAYISMAQNLRQRATETGGREQMAIEAFAEALETIPATIAENAGHDPLDTVLSLRNVHQQGHRNHGPDIETGGTVDMRDIGVWEPLSLVKQSIQSASEVSISILRIDDIIGKKES